MVGPGCMVGPWSMVDLCLGRVQVCGQVCGGSGSMMCPGRVWGWVGAVQGLVGSGLGGGSWSGVGLVCCSQVWFGQVRVQVGVGLGLFV